MLCARHSHQQPVHSRHLPGSLALLPLPSPAAWSAPAAQAGARHTTSNATSAGPRSIHTVGTPRLCEQPAQEHPAWAALLAAAASGAAATSEEVTVPGAAAECAKQSWQAVAQVAWQQRSSSAVGTVSARRGKQQIQLHAAPIALKRGRAASTRLRLRPGTSAPETARPGRGQRTAASLRPGGAQAGLPQHAHAVLRSKQGTRRHRPARIGGQDCPEASVTSPATPPIIFNQHWCRSPGLSVPYIPASAASLPAAAPAATAGTPAAMPAAGTSAWSDRILLASGLALILADMPPEDALRLQAARAFLACF